MIYSIIVSFDSHFVIFFDATPNTLFYNFKVANVTSYSLPLIILIEMKVREGPEADLHPYAILPISVNISLVICKVQVTSIYFKSE